jgi:hypothetical protein
MRNSLNCAWCRGRCRRSNFPNAINSHEALGDGLSSGTAGSRSARSFRFPFARSGGFALRSPLITTNTVPRCLPKADAQLPSLLFASLCSDYQTVPLSTSAPRATLSPGSSPLKADSTSPDQPATLVPRHQQPTRSAGSPSSSRCSLTARDWSEACCAVKTCSIEDPSGVINRRQKKQAICASAACCAFSVHYWPPIQLAERGHDQDQP